MGLPVVEYTANAGLLFYVYDINDNLVKSYYVSEKITSNAGLYFNYNLTEAKKYVCYESFRLALQKLEKEVLKASDMNNIIYALNNPQKKKQTENQYVGAKKLIIKTYIKKLAIKKYI